MHKIGFIGLLGLYLPLSSALGQNKLDGPGNVVLEGVDNIANGRDNIFNGYRNDADGDNNNFKGDDNTVRGNHNDVDGD